MFAFGEELQPVPTGQILLLTLDNLWLHFQLYMMIVWCSFPRRRSYWVRHAFHEPPRTSAWEAKSDDPQSVSVCILAWEGKNDSKWSSEIQAICNQREFKRLNTLILWNVCQSLLKGITRSWGYQFEIIFFSYNLKRTRNCYNPGLKCRKAY